MPRMRWRPGLRPGPRWEAHDAPPDPIDGWGGGHPLPKNSPRRLDPRAFGARCSAPSSQSSVPNYC